jgi:predicted ATPase/DNA-binding XRE family transcriptional regulator
MKGLEAMATQRVLTFADALRRFRQRSGLTQEELAAHTGLGVRTISDLERGISRTPRLDTVIRLADALHLSDEENATFLAAARHSRMRSPSPTSTPHPPLRPLPSPLTPLIGREHEEASIAHLLRREEVRLLTLTGSPGIGKTRLAIQVAGGMGQQFTDGVILVELAAIREAAFVLPTIAQALGVRDTGAQPLREALSDYCASRQLLLVLDNFEQVLSAAGLVRELLTSCPALKVMVTSRAVLHLRGEHEFVVSPLSLPDQAEPLPGLDDLSQYSAVTLFVQRARAVRPTFQLTDALAPIIVRICQRLDGLPLSIELAAARIKLLAPRELLDRLEHSLDVLAGDRQDLPERQRTLRGAIAWSESLLTAEEQALFRHLAIFAGGWTLEAAEAICASESDKPGDVLARLTALVDKSLVQVQETAEGALRFGLLETLCEYAHEQLQAHAEMGSFRRRHAEYFVSLAEQAEHALRGPDQLEWLERLEREHDNLRAALAWALQRGDTEAGLRLGNGAWRFWEVRGHLAEGRKWLETFIELDANQQGPLRVGVARAKALSYLGMLVHDQGDFAQAIVWQEASLAAWRELEDISGIAIAVNHLANALIYQGNYTRSVALYEESLALRRQLGDKNSIGIVLNNLGFAADNQGAYAQAEHYHQESLALRRECGDEIGIALSLQSLGGVALHQGEYARAQALLEESLTRSRALKNTGTTAYCLVDLSTVYMRQGEHTQAAITLEESRALFQGIGDKRGIAYALLGLGDLAQTLGDLSSAAARYHESLALFKALGSVGGIIDNLEGLARIAKGDNCWEDAVLIYASAAAARESLGTPVSLADRVRYERDMTDLRVALGVEVFTTAWTDGKALSLDEALAKMDAQD